MPVTELRKRGRLLGVRSLSLGGELVQCEEERWTLAALRSFLVRLSRGSGSKVGVEGSSGEKRSLSSRVGVVARVEVSETQTEKSEGAELMIESVRRALEGELELGSCVWVWVEVEVEAGWEELGSSKQRSGNFSGGWFRGSILAAGVFSGVCLQRGSGSAAGDCHAAGLAGRKQPSM